jgi:hypothetical protein
MRRRGDSMSVPVGVPNVGSPRQANPPAARFPATWTRQCWQLSSTCCEHSVDDPLDGLVEAALTPHSGFPLFLENLWIVGPRTFPQTL